MVNNALLSSGGATSLDKAIARAFHQTKWWLWRPRCPKTTPYLEEVTIEATNDGVAQPKHQVELSWPKQNPPSARHRGRNPSMATSLIYPSTCTRMKLIARNILKTKPKDIPIQLHDACQPNRPKHRSIQKHTSYIRGKLMRTLVLTMPL